MKKYLALLKWAVSKTPEAALNVLKQLNFKNWKIRLGDIVEAPFSPKFEFSDTIKERMIVISFWFNGKYIVAKSRLKNDGSDTITIDGVTQLGVDFDFDIIGFTNTVVQVELRYTSPDGVRNEFKIYNDGVTPFNF